MPDFEGLTDQMGIDMAKTPEVKHYRIGFVDGKTRGRLEVAIIFGLVTLAWTVWELWSGV